MIKEIIVVEGKDDIAAVKRAVEAEVIATGGFSLNPRVMKMIHTAAEKKGIIIFTDPDYAGEQIRKRISREIKGAKHAFLPQDQATKGDDIGIENATPASIIKALEGARAESLEPNNQFAMEDLVYNGLANGPGSSILRAALGETLGIGYGNCKQFLNRLNNYGVTREEFNKALEAMESDIGE